MRCVFQKALCEVGRNMGDGGLQGSYSNGERPDPGQQWQG